MARSDIHSIPTTTTAATTTRSGPHAGFTGLVGVGVLLALAMGCNSQCLDDGVAWSQKKDACVGSSETESQSATDTATMTATNTATMTATESDSGSQSNSDSEGLDQLCKDADMDGQGDPDDCIPGDGDNPPPGYVPNDDDCDDTDENTFRGAAELDDPEACMTDVDGDGYGDPTPAPGVVPGTDCLDSNPNAFPGSAELEDPEACMEDEDNDGWGDSDPPDGVDPGTDCNDGSASTFPGSAENEEGMECQTDEDGDGYGDIDPEPGGVPGQDCDDSNEHTFPGAAPNDDPDACMKDDDGDDWGDVEPPEGVIPGTDCDDMNGSTFPGAAENEVDNLECMRDVDDDGFGDDNPPAGVTPGIDCNDADAEVVVDCADCEAEQLFCLEDNVHLCNMNGNGSKLEETCEIGCDEEKAACIEVLSVDAGESVCIDQGAMAQLQAVAMGGDGAYSWDWTPAESLDDPKSDNPVASPGAATTYTVTVTDGQNDTAMDNVSVFIKDAALVLDDVSCKITNFQWAGAPAVNWNWNPNPGELCQLSNSSPTARFCGWSLDNANIQGRFQIKTGSDDDYVGFLWGIQPFDQMTMEPEQFYFMGWKQGSQLGFCGNESPQSGKAGIIVKRIDVKDAMNAPLTCADFHDPNDTMNSVTLADEDEFTNVGWLDNVPYIFDLTHTPMGFTVKVIREDNMMVVAEKEFMDDTFPNGQVGFYAFSQQNACFSQFKTSCL